MSDDTEISTTYTLVKGPNGSIRDTDPWADRVPSAEEPEGATTDELELVRKVLVGRIQKKTDKQVEGLMAKVETLDARLQEMSSQATEQKTATDGELEAMQSKQDELRADHMSAVQSHAKRLEPLEARVESLETRVQEVAAQMQARMDEMQARFDAQLVRIERQLPDQTAVLAAMAQLAGALSPVASSQDVPVFAAKDPSRDVAPVALPASEPVEAPMVEAPVETEMAAAVEEATMEAAVEEATVEAPAPEPEPVEATPAAPVEDPIKVEAPVMVEELPDVAPMVVARDKPEEKLTIDDPWAAPVESPSQTPDIKPADIKEVAPPKMPPPPPVSADVDLGSLDVLPVETGDVKEVVSRQPPPAPPPTLDVHRR